MPGALGSISNTAKQNKIKPHKKTKLGISVKKEISRGRGGRNGELVFAGYRVSI
jgi:hypothetical protein